MARDFIDPKIRMYVDGAQYLVHEYERTKPRTCVCNSRAFFFKESHINFTKKPAETRMGKGKGNPEYWVAVVKPGRILYEMDGVTPDVAKEAFRLASHKLPIATKCVIRGEF